MEESPSKLLVQHYSHSDKEPRRVCFLDAGDAFSCNDVGNANWSSLWTWRASNSWSTSITSRQVWNYSLGSNHWLNLQKVAGSIEADSNGKLGCFIIKTNKVLEQTEHKGFVPVNFFMSATNQTSLSSSVSVLVFSLIHHWFCVADKNALASV